MFTRLVLIRHGETDCNRKRRYSGHVDVSLNATGKSQVKKLQKVIASQKIHKVYSSDRRRAMQSAKIIFKGKKITKVPHLKEIHFGVFEGLTYKQIMKKYPDIYAKWLKNPSSVTIPGGENLKSFKKRVIKAFRNIVSHDKNKTVAVVSHGGVISIFVNHILGTDNFWGQVPKSASVTVIEYKNKKAKLLAFNDISHLG